MSFYAAPGAVPIASAHIGSWGQLIDGGGMGKASNWGNVSFEEKIRSPTY